MQQGPAGGKFNGDAFSILFAVRPLTRKESRLQGHSACGFGWCSDWEGYWIEKAQTGCGDAGYNAHSGPAGAWCCNPPAGRAVVCGQFNTGCMPSLYPACKQMRNATDFGDLAIISDDGGQHWRAGGKVMMRPADSSGRGIQPDECTIAALPNGSLVLNARDEAGGDRRLIAFSHDGGESFTDLHQAADLPDPTCEGAMIASRFSGSIPRLFFTNAHSADNGPAGRANGTLSVSDDGAASWRAVASIEPGAFAYSALVEINQTHLGVIFETGPKPDETSGIVFRHCVTSGGGEWSCRAPSMPLKSDEEATPAAGLWTRTSRAARVSVDLTSFAYTAALLDDSNSSTACGLLEGGGVSFRCEGVQYSTNLDASHQPLTMLGTPTTHTGQHSRLGSFEAIGVAWKGGTSPACTIHTEVQYFAATESFVFQANFSHRGVANTSTAGVSTSKDSDGCVGGWFCPWTPPLLSAFPSWPAAKVGESCGYYSYQGNSLSMNWRQGPLSQWQGGMQGGPLLLYPDSYSAFHPPALLLSPLNHPKTMIGHNGTDHFAKGSPRVSFGVHGYVEELPSDFSHATVLVGRQGIAATQMAWGETVRRHAGTTRLSLDQDPLNSKVRKRARVALLPGAPSVRWLKAAVRCAICS